MIGLTLSGNPGRRGRPAGCRPALWVAWSAALLVGCATPTPYERPELSVPAAWSAGASNAGSRPGQALWWQALNDSALNAFVGSTLADNPTLAQALARLDESRAQVGVNAAQRLPSITATAGASRAKGLATTGGGVGTSADALLYSNSAAIGPTISWEPDLFGRVRLSVEAASRRLDARTADAESVRLALAADVVGNVLSLRACAEGREVLGEDIQSRELALKLIRQRVAVGASAPVDEARSRSGLASARTSLVAREEQCARTVNALVALSGSNAATVRALIPVHVPAAARARLSVSSPAPVPVPTTDPRTTALAMPPPATVPKAVLQLPAQVLTQHPAVRTAERDAAAAWADIGIARADRLPRFDLMAALSGQWLNAAGSTLRYTAWSLGSSVSGTLFDGGAGAANVDAAEARYRAAVAVLRQSVLTAARDVEDALAASGSAETRAASTAESIDAARQTFVTTQDQWRAGAVSLFELEDARRQWVSALDASIAAERDRGLAWVALVRACGNNLSDPDPSP
jgi:outer membrane protein TolC